MSKLNDTFIELSHAFEKANRDLNEFAKTTEVQQVKTAILDSLEKLKENKEYIERIHASLSESTKQASRKL